MGIELIAYCRISKDKTGGGLAVERQEKEIRQWAEANGHTIAELFTDNDISAYSGKKRPGFEAVLEHENKNVVVWHQDRLLRVMSDLQRVIDAKLTVYQVKAGLLDLSTSQGRFTASIVASMSTLEMEQKTERQLSKNRQLAAQGKYRGAIRPFGQERTGQWVESEATAVREGVKALLATDKSRMSFYGISVLWNDAGLRTPQTGKQGGRQWTAGTVRQYFQRPRLYGYQEYKGALYALTDWEPLLTRQEFDDIQILIDENKTKHQGQNGSEWRSPVRHDIHLLTGILRCSEADCNRGMNVGYRGGKYNAKYYKCPTTGHPSIVAHSVEYYISQHALQLLSQDAEMHERTKRVEKDALKLRRDRSKLIGEHDTWLAEAIEAPLSPKLIAQRVAHHDSALAKIDAELATVDSDMMLSLFDTKPTASARRELPMKPVKRVEASVPTVPTVNPFTGEVTPPREQEQQDSAGSKVVDWGEVIANAPALELSGWNEADVLARRKLLGSLFSRITASRRTKGSRAPVGESVEFEYSELGEKLYKAWAVSQVDDVDARKLGLD